MQTQESKPRRIQPGSRTWHKLAYEELQSFTPIKSCRDCGGPVIVGYCCNRCGSVEP